MLSFADGAAGFYSAVCPVIADAVAPCLPFSTRIYQDCDCGYVRVGDVSSAVRHHHHLPYRRDDRRVFYGRLCRQPWMFDGRGLLPAHLVSSSVICRASCLDCGSYFDASFDAVGPLNRRLFYL